MTGVKLQTCTGARDRTVTVFQKGSASFLSCHQGDRNNLLSTELYLFKILSIPEGKKSFSLQF